MVNLKTFNRPTARPTPFPYLGIQWHLGKAESKPGKETWAVWRFSPNSAAVLAFSKKDLQTISRRVLLACSNSTQRESRWVSAWTFCWTVK